ncbi:MAG: diadenylate cyclase CdaA [Clostridia bacterium]|nr:diadenylate cyclase CdaA [Clostridia bacterium]
MLENVWLKFIDIVYKLGTILNLTSPIRVVILIIDIAVVAFIVYYVFRIIKQTRAEQIFKGILILLVLLIVSKIFDMVILNFILTNIMTYGMLLFIVIFQPELRSAFEKIGRNKFVDVFDMEDNIMVKHNISEIVKAVEIMSLKKIGSLIVIERNTKISEVLKEGITLSAKVSNELLQNIFMPRTPLHDGAVVIEKGEIAAAKCILPLASENNVPKSLGTRHRAAIGITEISDAIVVVVSEETGIISVAENGKLKRDLTGDSLKDLLNKKLDRTVLSKTSRFKHKN